MASGTAYVAVYYTSADTGWPYDVGDDPSFRSSLLHADRLTWGVCRRNLRNRLRPGDLVVFVATERILTGRPARYLLSGWATVDRTVSHTDVWNQESLAIYRQYLNLLLRPVVGTEDFEYHEPISNDHEDWLARIGNAPAQLFSKADAVEAGKGGRLRQGMIEVNGNRLRPARNYVIFAPEDAATRLLMEPPLLAQASRTGKAESWVESPLAADVQKLLLDGQKRKSLRTTNVQTAHCT